MSERIEEQTPKELARMAMCLPEGGEPKFFDVPEEVVQELDRRTRKAMDYWRRVKYAEDQLATLTAELARRQQQVEVLRAACEAVFEADPFNRLPAEVDHLVQSALAATAEPGGEGGGSVSSNK